VEAVYHQTFDKKPHVFLMEKRVALTKFTFPSDIPFCKEAAMLFFSNTAYKDELSEIFKKLSEALRRQSAMLQNPLSWQSVSLYSSKQFLIDECFLKACDITWQAKNDELSGEWPK
jgi:hypothetical protein